MKTIRIIKLLAVFLGTANVLNAQTSVQSTRWAVPGKQVYFADGGTTTASSLATGPVFDGVNSFTYMDGPMLFQIVDNEIKSVSGNFLATLGNSSTWRGPEYATTMVKNECNTFITFYLERDYYSLFTNEKLCYSQYSRNPVTGVITMITSGQVLRTETQDAFGGIALSNERPDGSRFLYYVSTNLNTRGYVRKYTISASGSIDNGVEIYSGSNQAFRLSELELSHDGSRLAFARTDVIGGNCNVNQDVIIFQLDPGTGNLSSAIPVTINLRSNDGDLGYPGIEFSANSQNLFVLAQSGGLYKINTSSYAATLIGGFNSQYSDSQLELGRDGWYYLAKADGLYRMDSQGNVSLFSSGTMAYNDLLANRGHTVYVLPDQVDGQDYNSYMATIACCYGNTESLIKTVMSGVSENSTTGDITISGSNVIWTSTSNPFTSGGQAISDIYLRGKITINQGAKLTITGLTLHFKEAKTLDMSYNPSGAGSRLVLNSSKLTAFDYCEPNVMWEGIKCSGYWGEAQGSTSNSKQPYTYMNNSTIEYATVGVEANTGGILKAYNSQFKDNIRDVSFVSFTTNDNISEFSSCNFYTTQVLYEKGHAPLYHAHIWTAPGLLFKACNFSNQYAASVPLSQWGVGILSTNSSLTINAKCLVPEIAGYPCPAASTVRGTFTNLYYGVKASSGDFMTISRQNFNNCLGGAWLIGCDAIRVTENQFDVSSMNPDQGLGRNFESFGLYVANSTGYQVEGNQFYDGILGMVVYASGGSENNVYRNNFSNMSGNGQASGIVGIGINYDYDTKYGLQFLCNDFANVDYAMAVLGGDVYNSGGQPVTVTQSDIRNTQGMDTYNFSHFSTHNHFSGIPLNENRFFIVDPTVSMMPYYAYNQEDADGYRLESYAQNIHVYNQIIPTCEQRIYIPPVVGPVLSELKSLREEEAKVNAVLNEILESYNGFSLNIIAQSAKAGNAGEVYNQLRKASPRLTSDILLSYLNNPDVPEAYKVSLMLDNSPLPVEVAAAIENSGLSSQFRESIRIMQVGENEVEKLERQVSVFHSARQVRYDAITREILNADTTDAYAMMFDEVTDFMKTEDDYYVRNRLVDLYIFKRKYDDALNLLSMMKKMPEAQNASEANDIRLSEIMIGIFQNPNKGQVEEMVMRHKDFLRETAAEYNTKEGGVARAILESVGLTENMPIVFLPDPGMKNAVSTVKPLATSNPVFEKMFRVCENPVNDYLIIEYINPYGSCHFDIYSIQGVLLRSVGVDQQQGYARINISDLPAGSYMIHSPELRSCQKFVITK